MTKVKAYSKALGKSLVLGRYIGRLHGEQPGPSLVFTAGMHGNEPSGVFALRQVFDFLKQHKLPLKGNCYALAGNLWALQHGERYHQQDLNRLWRTERIQQLEEGQLLPEHEDARQQLELYGCLKEIMAQDQGPFYFMDLHTTSCETIPFLLLNDSLLNRKFTVQYPLPMILGIEEYLEGPLLSYINELGYVAFGFEAGQHDERVAIENHKSFILLSLVFAGCLQKNEVDFDHHYGVLAKHTLNRQAFYEIFYRHAIREGERFKMLPGYVNFQRVKKGQQLAFSNGSPIYADRTARVFMPLYQQQGAEGFFAIRRVPKIFLRLSAAIRRLKVDRLLPLLPGVRRADSHGQSLQVNRRLARFFTRDFFHLMGYRSKRLDRTHYLMKSREATARNAEYQQAAWYNAS